MPLPDFDAMSEEQLGTWMRDTIATEVQPVKGNKHIANLLTDYLIATVTDNPTAAGADKERLALAVSHSIQHSGNPLKTTNSIIEAGEEWYEKIRQERIKAQTKRSESRGA